MNRTTLRIFWKNGRENTLTFATLLDARRHKESMEIVFKDKIERVEVKSG